MENSKTEAISFIDGLQVESRVVLYSSDATATQLALRTELLRSVPDPPVSQDAV